MPWIWEVQFLHAGRRENLGLQRRAGDLDLDLLVVQFTLAQLLAEFLTRSVIVWHGGAVVTDVRRRWQQGVEQTILGRVLGTYARSSWLARGHS